MSLEELATRSSKVMICNYLDRVKEHGKYQTAKTSHISSVCGGMNVGGILKEMEADGLIKRVKVVGGSEWMSIDGWREKLGSA